MEESLKSNISPSLPNRMKLETKDKFDALLKEALNSKTRKDAINQSTQKLIPDDVTSLSSSSSDENLPVNSGAIEVVEADVHDDNNFILNKFLNDSTRIMQNEQVAESVDSIIKPPVPQPRKNKQVPLIVHSPTNSSNNNSTQKIITEDVQETSKKSYDQISPYKEILKSPKSNLKDIIEERISQKSEVSSIDEIKYENEIRPKRKKKQLLEKPKQKETFKNVAETVIVNQVKVKYSYQKIIAITVHKSDRLKLDSLVVHPVVKIHVVNSETGEYLNKSDKDRSVIFYYENKDIKYVTPVISEPYCLYEKGSLFPVWEETLIINEDIDYLVAKGDGTVIFFEIMDFVTFSVANAQFNQKGTSKGWHKIAWAFFKPIGKNNISNLDKTARLQLYYPGKQLKVPPQTCDIFHWWKNKKLTKYPSSLYVTVGSIIPPEKITETLRSKTPIHGEKASRVTLDTDINVIQKSLPNKSISSDKIDSNSGIAENLNRDTVWSRSSYQSCKLPNRCVSELPSYEEGCLMLKFSMSGLYLACAVRIDDIYWIVVYSVKTYEEICKYSGHQGLIYDINWSSDDNFIITASADCTVCIWNFIKNVFVEMLPHPSYVYSSEISSKNVIATGCYDQIIRIWHHQADIEIQYSLIQELEEHKGYITSLCFNKKGSMLYSSDSIGTIIEWKYNTSDNNWILRREIKFADLRNTIINQILLHPRERRLLVHARDSTLRIIDLKTSCVLHWLQGALNNRFKTSCTFSPCSNYIFAGSENGLINAWNTDVGKLIATYTPYNLPNYQNSPIHCVHFHPHDNIIAVSHYGRNLPILLMMYDCSIIGSSNVGFKMLQCDDEMEAMKKKRNSRSSISLKSAIGEIISENPGSEKKQKGQIKFEDVLNKIDQIVSKKSISNSSTSVNNNINNI